MTHEFSDNLNIYIIDDPYVQYDNYSKNKHFIPKDIQSIIKLFHTILQKCETQSSLIYAVNYGTEMNIVINELKKLQFVTILYHVVIEEHGVYILDSNIFGDIRNFKFVDIDVKPNKATVTY